MIKVDQLQGVYFIRNDKTNYIKIGCSKDISARLKQLRSNNLLLGTKENFELIDYILCSDYFKLEKDIHQYLSDHRIHGEWFDINSEEISRLKNIFNAVDYMKETTRELLIVTKLDSGNLIYDNNEKILTHTHNYNKQLFLSTNVLKKLKVNIHHHTLIDEMIISLQTSTIGDGEFMTKDSNGICYFNMIGFITYIKSFLKLSNYYTITGAIELFYKPLFKIFTEYYKEEDVIFEMMETELFEECVCVVYPETKYAFMTV